MVSDADAQLALRIASGLATSAPPEMRVADVVSSPAEGAGPRISILDAVQLLRGAHGFLPRGVTGTALMQARDDVQLQKDAVRNFTLARAFRFSGRVLDENGQPVDASVELEDASGDQKAFSQFDAGKGFQMTVGTEALRPRVFSQYPAFKDKSAVIYYSAVLPPKETIALTGDKHRDITRPERPQTGFITGTVSGGDSASVSVNAMVRLDGGASGWGQGTANDRKFTVECPSGEATLELTKSTGN